MINLEYSDKKIRVIYPCSISNSVSNVDFSSVSIDFTVYKP